MENSNIQNNLDLPVKYENEAAMCRDCTKMISGFLAPKKHVYIPEVPRFSHNDHADMLNIN
jgi:hypothetical protein